MRAKVGHSTISREYLYHDNEVNHERLYKDYFFDRPTYGCVKFKRRYKMRRDLFMHIVDMVTKIDPWFVQRLDAFGQLRLSML